MSRENLNKVLSKYRKIEDIPYIDKDNIKKVVDVLDRFVNQFDTNEMISLAIEVANTKDEYSEHIKSILDEDGIVIPDNQDDAIDIGFAAIGNGMTQTHRTLQQNFMRIMLSFIEIQSAMYEAEIYDARNEQTCKFCNIMWNAVKDRDDLYLPLV